MARRVAGSQDVKDAGNEMLRTTKEFLGAVYDAARPEPTKEATKKVPTEQKASKKL